MKTKLEKELYQRSYLFFIGFLALVIAGFWYTYIMRIRDQENYRMHVHGLALFVWCFLLVGQAYLVRTKQYKTHRTLGLVSYAWVPFMLYSTLDLLHYSLRGRLPLTTMDVVFVALVVNALVIFVVLYALAMVYRKQPLVHGRFMLCTVFPMITPATDRIVHIYFRPMVPYLYTIEGNPVAPVVGFALGDVVLLILCWWDWKAHRRIFVFPLALALLLLYHYSVLNFYRFGFWQSFSEWIATL